ncbi:hypothetical protein ACNFBT_04885 [Pseudomonas sp. NY15181]|uniref:hypothetical protein n=1 Tax=Pseudomonas sp. NY15181 TaxID=3400349 RepID=UPI003A8B6530
MGVEASIEQPSGNPVQPARSGMNGATSIAVQSSEGILKRPHDPKYGILPGVTSESS